MLLQNFSKAGMNTYSNTFLQACTCTATRNFNVDFFKSEIRKKCPFSIVRFKLGPKPRSDRKSDWLSDLNYPKCSYFDTFPICFYLKLQRWWVVCLDSPIRGEGKCFHLKTTFLLEDACWSHLVWELTSSPKLQASAQPPTKTRFPSKVSFPIRLNKFYKIAWAAIFLSSDKTRGFVWLNLYRQMKRCWYNKNELYPTSDPSLFAEHIFARIRRMCKWRAFSPGLTFSIFCLLRYRIAKFSKGLFSLNWKRTGSHMLEKLNV